MDEKGAAMIFRSKRQKTVLEMSDYLWNTGLCAAAAIGAVSLYAMSTSPETFVRATGLSVVAGLAAFWLVGIIGFIFGIPRVPPGDTTQNQNLGDVSDWLTKIIIGASLVEIRSIGGFILDVGSDIGASSTLPAGPQLYTALLVATGTAGFVFFYFWAYMYWRILLEPGEQTVPEPDVLGRVGSDDKDVDDGGDMGLAPTSTIESR